MIPKPFRSVVYEWLKESGDRVDGSRDRNFGSSGWTQYPMPPKDGEGGYEALDLSLGMTFVRSTVDFSPSVLGKMLPLMEIDAEFTEPTFHAMALRGVRGAIHEVYPLAQLAVSPGIDLFRYTTHYKFNFIADASFSGEACHVSIGQSVLSQLIGKEVSAALLDGLEIAALPSTTAKQIPLHISQLMFNAATTTLTGMTRNLYCQAKTLEYLAALVHFVCSSAEAAPEYNQRSRRRSHALHERLLACQGKLPTLDELASEFGRSAKLLNDEFSQEYGKSIYAFVTDHRLQQAHESLQDSQISIKQLAANQGYSHVNNFTAAFKNRFGYTPGSLRRKPVDES